MDSTDVTKILLDVVPGEDGMGQEVYAKNIGDVINVLNKLAEDYDILKNAFDQALNISRIDVTN